MKSMAGYRWREGESIAAILSRGDVNHTCNGAINEEKKTFYDLGGTSIITSWKEGPLALSFTATYTHRPSSFTNYLLKKMWNGWYGVWEDDLGEHGRIYLYIWELDPAQVEGLAEKIQAEISQAEKYVSR